VGFGHSCGSCGSIGRDSRNVRRYRELLKFLTALVLNNLIVAFQKKPRTFILLALLPTFSNGIQLIPNAIEESTIATRRVLQVELLSLLA
jgi:hypothetical protein